MFDILGSIGAAIILLAYVPQIFHMISKKCSAGVSIRAWGIWLLGSALMLLHAINLQDIIFLCAQITNVVAIVIIIVLARKYSRSACSLHSHKHDGKKLTLT